MLKIISPERVVILSPNAGWSLRPGANHFDEEPPEAVAKRYAELAEAKVITVEVLDGDGKATAWPGPKPTKSDKKT